MAIGERVLLEGEVYYIIGEAIIETPIDNQASVFNVCLAVNKVETASVKGIGRAIWLRKEQVYPFLSSLDYRFSEWFLGVYDGK